MAKMTKHHLSALLRSARPNVHPDADFVGRLQLNLQKRAAELTTQAAYAQPTTTRLRQSWLWLSSLGVGAAALALFAIMIVPQWLGTTPGLTGYIQKGPFISGSSITIQELDTQLQPTGVSYQVTTASDFGDYHLGQAIQSDYVEVIADGYYFNEVSGELSAAPLTLRAIAEVTTNGIVNVNLLTTLAAPRIRHIVNVDDTSFKDAKHIAEQEVLNVFQITEPNIADFETMNISQDGINNGILLAVSVMLQGRQSVAELSELLSKLSLAIRTDGTVDTNGPLLETIKTNASQLNTADIRNNLKERYKAVGEPGTVPAFEQWLEPFAATADPFSYRISLLDNVFGVDRTAGATIKATIYGNGFVEGQEWVSLKNTVDASAVEFVDDHTLVATFPIEKLSAGSYTVKVENTATGRIGVTDGKPLEDDSTDAITKQRLILRGYAPSIASVTPTIDYLSGGTITIIGKNFAFGSFVSINGWKVPKAAIRIANSTKINVDLSPALIADNTALPRKTDLTVTVQTPDFQTATFNSFQIQ